VTETNADGSAESRQADLVIETKNATPVETAAVTAVVTAVLDALDDDRRIHDTRRSGWDRSARAIRSPLGLGEGVWRTFNG